MLSRPRLSEQRGFTFIELMVTMTIVTIGLGGVLTLVDGMNARSVATQERQSGTALVREVIEGARSVPYFRLTDGALDTDLQAQPGLTDSAAASGWTVRRRNREYTLDTQVCTVDDPKDGLGEHSVAGYCEGSGTGTADRNPDDYRRLSVKATFDRNGAHRSVEQTAVVANETNTTGPRITRFDPTPSVAEITTDVGEVAFSTETSTQAASIKYAIDGVPAETDEPAGLSSSFRWRVDGNAGRRVPDGTYLVSATAFDADGRPGVARSQTIRLNRDLPQTPAPAAGGWNALRSAVEIEWSRNPEPDIVGYRVFRRVGLTTEVVPSCDFDDQPKRTACVDENPPGTPSTYWVVALDRSSESQALRAGAPSTAVSVIPSTNKPNQPTALAAREELGDLWLDWARPPSADPSYSGDAIRFYRIYRGGTGVSDRLGRTEDDAHVAYKDYGEAGNGGRYWITAVDQHFSESEPLGPVQAP